MVSPSCRTEVATEFRGRGFAVELLPLSFAEALLFARVPIPTVAATREREIRALSEAMTESGLREATMVTMYTAEEIPVASGVFWLHPLTAAASSGASSCR